MRFLLSTVLIALLAYVAGMFFPWWCLAIVAFGVALLVPQKGWGSFGAGFLGIFILWAAVAVWIDTRNNSLLSQKVAQLFSLGNSTVLLVLVTALIGALVGGFAALTGGKLRKLMQQDDSRY
ncbi:hypothetical protein [Pseudocnuella soli]|uniref:hypothetical protein n=1 Tax=Pseudocnuella soli TaxID=2502779 RepID=UPI00104C7565|nr:hypothetical protein [Pseudocnuella soli]